MTTLSSPNGTLTFGKSFPTMQIYDQLQVINITGEVIEPLSRGKIDHFKNLAKWGKSVGNDLTAILITHPGFDEFEILPKLFDSNYLQKFKFFRKKSHFKIENTHEI